MKKTIPTSIARTLFYVEEGAYQKLDEYLTEVRKYFAHYDDNKEIIEDIESRIEEQLRDLSTKDKTDRIITEAHIDILIKTMGRPDEFGTEETANTENTRENADSTSRKKLYRDKENAVIGGVASGLALYFGVDPIIVRAIFFISVFFGGFGVIAYIFLWFAVPEAKTATEKLEMGGTPVTLNEVKKMVEEKLGDVGGKDGIKKSAEKFRHSILGFFRIFFKTFGKVIGVCFKIIAFLGTVTLVTLLIIGVTSSPVSFLGAAAIPPLLVYGSIGILFILVLIPFLFIGLAGGLLSHPKKSSHKTLTGILALIWILACIAGTVVGFHIANNRETYARSIPGSETVTINPLIKDFSRLHVRNGQNVSITEGRETSIQITGIERSVNHIELREMDGTLTISHKNMPKSCFLCSMKRADIVITIPTLSLASIELENGSNLSFEGTAKDLVVSAENGSQITLIGKAATTSLDLKNASRYEGQDFIVRDFKLDLRNGSFAQIHATDSLTGELSNGSRAEQYGLAAIDDLTLENGSRADMR
ncbi:MAG: PspC domain-containing protein [Patescibacteria group bacterium]